MIINKKIKYGMFFLLAVIIFFPLISAFAISAPYMENKTIYMLPGQEKNLRYQLQNSESENLSASAAVLEGSEIIRLIDPSTFDILAGEKKYANFRVSIPDNASIGNVYNVKLTFGTGSAGGAGKFTFGSAIDQGFRVVVGEEPKPEPTLPTPEQPKNNLIILLIIIGILSLAVVIITVNKLRKNKQ
mgnify:CR=1 FL=1